jgi:hypothetical protein
VGTLAPARHGSHLIPRSLLHEDLPKCDGQSTKRDARRIRASASGCCGAFLSACAQVDSVHSGACVELSECRQVHDRGAGNPAAHGDEFTVSGHRSADSVKRLGFWPFPGWHKACFLDRRCDSFPRTSIGDRHRGRDARDGGCPTTRVRAGPALRGASPRLQQDGSTEGPLLHRPGRSLE